MREGELVIHVWRGLVEHGVRISDLHEGSIVLESDVEDVPDAERRDE